MDAGIFQFTITGPFPYFSAIVKEGQTGLCKLLNHLESNWELRPSAQEKLPGLGSQLVQSKRCFASDVGPGLGALA